MSHIDLWTLRERWTLRRTTATAALLLVIVALVRPAPLARMEDAALRAAADLPLRPRPSKELLLVTADRDAKTLLQLVRAIVRKKPARLLLDSTIVEALPANALAALRAEQVLGYAFATEPIIADQEKKEKAPEAFDRLALPAAPEDDTALVAMEGIPAPPAKRLAREGIVFGFVNVLPDDDGVVRTQPLAVRIGHQAFPHAALAAAAQSAGFTPIITMAADGKPNGIAIGERRIPTPPDARIAVSVRGGMEAFPQCTTETIIANEEDANTIADKTVLLSLDDEANTVTTVLGPMPRIAFVANVLDDLLTERWLQTAGRIWTALLVALLGALFVAFGPRFDALRQGCAALGVIALVWLIGLPLIAYGGVVPPIVELSLATIILLAALSAWRLIAVLLPRHLLCARLRGRLSPTAIDAVVADPQLLAGSPTHRPAVALALDTKGFGSIAARLEGKKLAAFLQTYRSLIAEAILAEGGFIDSWAGDECRALFGVPAAVQKPALCALRAAIAIRRAFAENAAVWRERFAVERLHVGIGIAAGEVVCSAPPGARRGELVITGGAVEAALALRALNRPYRTSILVDERIAEATGARFGFRPLLPVTLHGSAEAIVIFELIGEKAVILPQLQEYLRARKAYLEKRFDEARELLEKIVREHPHDGPAHLLLERLSRR